MKDGVKVYRYEGKWIAEKPFEDVVVIGVGSSEDDALRMLAENSKAVEGVENAEEGDE